jgi:capsular polysaccharide biosynthesis protein
MQLYHYFMIVRRSWPLVLALPLLAALASLALAFTRPPSYTLPVRLMITQALPTDGPPPSLRDQWDGTEFLIDDIPQVVTSALFAKDVALAPQAQAAGLDPALIVTGLSAETFHRQVTLQATAPTSTQARALAEAAVQTLQANGLKYWGRHDPTAATGLNMAVLDFPGEATSATSVRQIATNVALRTGLALAAAIGLAFLRSYLDPRLRSADEVATWVGLPVLSTIPPTEGNV